MTNAPGTPKDRTLLQQQYEIGVQRDYPRNAGLFFLFELVWGLGLPFAMFDTMVPAYLSELNCPKMVIGLVTPLLTILCPLQLLVAHYLAGRPQKYWITHAFAWNKVPWLIYALLVLFFPTLLPRPVMLFTFIMAMVWMAGIGTAFDAPYWAMTVDSIPVKKRGFVWGLRILALALAIIIGSGLAWKVMKADNPSLHNYHLSFAIGNVFYIAAVAFMAFVREHQNPQTETRQARQTRHHRLSRFTPRMCYIFRTLWRDPNYRLFIFFLGLFFISLKFGPFIVVYSREALNVGNEQIIWFSMIQLIVGALTAVIMGRVADKIGYKAVGVIQGIVLFAAFLMIAATTVIPGKPLLLLYGGYTLYSAVIYLNNMVLVNLSAEIMPRQSSTILIAMGNTIMMPLILLSVPLSGLIIDITHSYLAIFLVGMTLALVSSAGFVLFVREPRTHRRYVLRFMRRV